MFNTKSGVIVRGGIALVAAEQEEREGDHHEDGGEAESPGVARLLSCKSLEQ